MSSVDWRQHISGEPQRPAIVGTDVEVGAVLRLLGEGWSIERVIERFPVLHTEDVRACLDYATELLEREKFRALAKSRLAEIDAGAEMIPADELWRQLDAEFGPIGDPSDDER